MPASGRLDVGDESVIRLQPHPLRLVGDGLVKAVILRVQLGEGPG